MNTIKQIAYRLAQLCREKKFIEAYYELYSDEYAGQNLISPLKKRPTVIEHIKQFLSKAIIHSIEVSSPLFSGDYFAIDFRMDFSMAHQGRKYLEEICICHVNSGKITWQPRFMD